MGKSPWASPISYGVAVCSDWMAASGLLRFNSVNARTQGMLTWCRIVSAGKRWPRSSMMAWAWLASPVIAKAIATDTRLLRARARAELDAASSRACEAFPTSACVTAQFACVTAVVPLKPKRSVTCTDRCIKIPASCILMQRSVQVTERLGFRGTTAVTQANWAVTQAEVGKASQALGHLHRPLHQNSSLLHLMQRSVQV